MWGTSSSSNVRHPKGGPLGSVELVDISLYAAPSVTSLTASTTPLSGAGPRRAPAMRKAPLTVTAVAGVDPDGTTQRLDTYA